MTNGRMYRLIDYLELLNEPQQVFHFPLQSRSPKLGPVSYPLSEVQVCRPQAPVEHPPENWIELPD